MAFKGIARSNPRGSESQFLYHHRKAALHFNGIWKVHLGILRVSMNKTVESLNEAASNVYGLTHVKADSWS